MTQPLALVWPSVRWALVVALAIGLTFGPSPSALGTPDSSAHAVLAEPAASDHGHSHEDDEPHGPSAGHAHGHDPADHSHQYAFLASGAGQQGLPPPLRWPSALSSSPDGTIGFGIERPPKRALSL